MPNTLCIFVIFAIDMLNKDITKPLTVFKASAGSGKTFTLAVRYISMLIEDPTCYERILAVTFTNKATEEMKVRILSVLYGIANGLSDVRSEMEEIKRLTGKDERFIIDRASKAMHAILHNYSFFRVQTIDTFFQSILRNLAHELDLSPNLHVDLNDIQVEEMAVEKLIDALRPGDRILKWLQDFIETNITDQKSWNVIKDIKTFGQNIFKDFYKRHSEELSHIVTDEKFFSWFTQELRQQKKEATMALADMANEMIEILKSNGVCDYEYINYGRSGSVLVYLEKIAEGKINNEATPARVASCIESPDKWAKKKTDKTELLVSIAEKCLCEKLRQLEEKRPELWCRYQSANLVLQHINELRLLDAISSTVDEINKEGNRFLLSNTPTLLNSLIGDSDSPFIFEKIGARLQHVMIDEFQDTSTTQWKNFKVILDNCIAQKGSHCLIVGDVKQSIYRWRSGDWRLLNNIESLFPPKTLHIEPLSVNYRSEENIILFNNAFFKYAVRRTINDFPPEQTTRLSEFENAYNEEGLVQKSNKKNGKGYVRIELFPSENYTANVMQSVLDSIRELKEKGVDNKDIAILVRKNSDIPEIAEYIATNGNGLSLVSDEAFRLDASDVVNVIIAALRVLYTPDDPLTVATLVKLYNSLKGYADPLASCVFTTDGTQNILERVAENRLLPIEFTDSILSLSTMPLIDAIDRIYTILNLSDTKGQEAYVNAFYDQVSCFIDDYLDDVPLFIEEWDNTLHASTIQSIDSGGIRILSIHKSKGLEYDNIIIPFCDWELEHRDIVWCGRKETPPYDRLPIIPIDYSRKGMCGTIYEDDYIEEYLQKTVDNMNLLYVAFTRAKKNLFVIGMRTKSSSKSVRRSYIIQESLQDLTESIPDSVITGLDDESSCLTFEFGSIHTKNTCNTQVKTEERNVFKPELEIHSITINTNPVPVNFRQSNKSREFVIDNDASTDKDTSSYIKAGNILHNVFSRIRTVEDIEPCLQRLQMEGLLDNEETNREDILNQIKVSLSNEMVRDWFSPGWKLFNECGILTKDANGNMKEYRPDRVMCNQDRTIVVDFKFGMPRPEYASQVSNYMSLVRQIGHKNVRGYIWYVLQDKIEEI